MKRVLLINVNSPVFEEKTLDEINKLHLKDKKKLAEKDVTLEELCKLVDDEQVGGYYAYPYEIEDDYTYFHLAKENSVEVVINKELELHISRGDVGYNIDSYRYVDQETVDDDHEYDDDFISSMWVSEDDLAEEE